MPEKIKAVIVNGDPKVRKQISDTLSFINDIQVTGEAESKKEGLAVLDQTNPDVVIVGEIVEGSDGFDFSEAVMEKAPFQPVLLVASHVDADAYRRAMHSGIKQILQLPVNQINLSDAIYQVHDLNKKQKKTISKMEDKKSLDIKEKTAKIISVFSTKGGVGKTTIAANLAVALKQMSGKVALLDFDVFSGDVVLAMDILPKRNISDIVNDINRLDLDLLESFMFRHSSGVMVMPAPLQPEYADFVSAEHIKKILKTLIWGYDYIVIDCASYMHDSVLMSLDVSDIILLPTTMDLFAIKNLKNCITALEGLNYSRRRLRVVVNRAFREAGITTKDITTTLGLPITVVLPQEDYVITSSVNQGMPAVSAFKRSRFTRGIYELAKNIM